MQERDDEARRRREDCDARGGTPQVVCRVVLRQEVSIRDGERAVAEKFQARERRERDKRDGDATPRHLFADGLHVFLRKKIARKEIRCEPHDLVELERRVVADVREIAGEQRDGDRAREPRRRPPAEALRDARGQPPEHERHEIPLRRIRPEDVRLPPGEDVDGHKERDEEQIAEEELHARRPAARVRAFAEIARDEDERWHVHVINRIKDRIIQRPVLQRHQDVRKHDKHDQAPFDVVEILPAYFFHAIASRFFTPPIRYHVPRRHCCFATSCSYRRMSSATQSLSVMVTGRP